ncbi:uncharacterized protein K02A2.6-like [Octopus sinensis]|uniref:Uncharacterized protein K02A2.6-like n=1 Tax=Octopus sinensis TaxID=2607531 RepID=A0A6P7TD78_9MOLL|nr:uncharacterized protein K02A2.6-like [Octopus sinensis]
MSSKGNGKVTKRKFANGKIKNIKVNMQLAIRSDITIVNEETWKYIDKPKLNKSTKVAHGVTDFSLEELGCCTKTKAKIIGKQNATPVFKPKRTVPFAAIDQVNKELERLESLGIIKKMDQSDWAAPKVYVKKENKLRVCSDFSMGLNDCLILHIYLLPSPEEVFAKLNGGKFFSKLDPHGGISTNSSRRKCSHLLTINTHHGLFEFKRLPFGVKVAPSIFQQVMDSMLDDCDFAIVCLDDIRIKSELHERRLEHVKRVFEKRIRL